MKKSLRVVAWLLEMTQSNYSYRIMTVPENTTNIREPVFKGEEIGDE